jgi:hypothetical protein
MCRRQGKRETTDYADYADCSAIRFSRRIGFFLERSPLRSSAKSAKSRFAVPPLSVECKTLESLWRRPGKGETTDYADYADCSAIFFHSKDRFLP